MKEASLMTLQDLFNLQQVLKVLDHTTMNVDHKIDYQSYERKQISYIINKNISNTESVTPKDVQQALNYLIKNHVIIKHDFDPDCKMLDFQVDNIKLKQSLIIVNDCLLRLQISDSEPSQYIDNTMFQHLLCGYPMSSDFQERPYLRVIFGLLIQSNNGNGSMIYDNTLKLYYIWARCNLELRKFFGDKIYEDSTNDSIDSEKPSLAVSPTDVINTMATLVKQGIITDVTGIYILNRENLYATLSLLRTADDLNY